MSNINNPHFKKYVDFLKEHKVERGAKFTHTSLNNPFGSFYIDEKEHTKFFRLYRHALENNIDLHLTEKHKSYGPIVVDIDMKYLKSTLISNRIYSSVLIEIVRLYVQIIDKYLNVKDEDLMAFVFEKGSPTEKETEFKDGIHIMFPHICAINQLQHMMRRDFINQVNALNLFDRLPLSNEVDDVVDKAVIEANNWLMYGSMKPNSPKYLLSRIYNRDLEAQDIDEYDSGDLVEMCSIRKFDEHNITPYKEGYSTDEIIRRYEESQKPKPVEGTGSVGRTNSVTLDDLRRVKNLVALLNPDRAEKYEDWLHIGFCLYNIDPSLLNIWIEFSRQSVKFKEGVCEKLWNVNFRNNDFTIASLYRWVREDNPLEFIKFLEAEVSDIIKQSIKSASFGTSYDVAKVIHQLHRFDYVCGSLKHNEWYVFKGHRWMPEENGYSINNIINEKIYDEYLKVSNLFQQMAMNSSGKDKENLLELQIKTLAFSKTLHTTKFKKDVITECAILFYDRDFFQKLDEKRNLIGFENGVLDLDTLTFRDGYPEDFITFTTKINYFPYNKLDEKIQQVEQFFADILPDQHTREYVLKFLGTCLQGHVPDEKFYIWTGSGGNGKSLTIKLLLDSLGDYGTIIPVSLLTRKRAASNVASPELAKLKGKRFCVFQEPENDDVIQVGLMKELTGNDKIQARALYGAPVEFYPQFKTLLACNKLPEIPSTDGGTWRRIRVVPFEMSFVDVPVEPNERKKDPDLRRNMETWHQPFMSMLVEYNRRIKVEGNSEPKKVTEQTNQYQQKSDLVLEYLNDRIEYSEEFKVLASDVYDDFKWWCNDSKNIKVPYDRKGFEVEVGLKKEPSVGGRFNGFRVKERGGVTMDPSNM
jgi:P4 family phage/plasmid primase-like protien